MLTAVSISFSTLFQVKNCDLFSFIGQHCVCSNVESLRLSVFVNKGTTYLLNFDDCNVWQMFLVLSRHQGGSRTSCTSVWNEAGTRLSLLDAMFKCRPHIKVEEIGWACSIESKARSAGDFTSRNVRLRLLHSIITCLRANDVILTCRQKNWPH